MSREASTCSSLSKVYEEGSDFLWVDGDDRVAAWPQGIAGLGWEKKLC